LKIFYLNLVWASKFELKFSLASVFSNTLVFVECQVSKKTRQRGFFAKCQEKHSAASLPSVFLALGKELFSK
jgi:hypothetical protein